MKPLSLAELQEALPAVLKLGKPVEVERDGVVVGRFTPVTGHKAERPEDAGSEGGVPSGGIKELLDHLRAPYQVRGISDEWLARRAVQLRERSVDE